MPVPFFCRRRGAGEEVLLFQGIKLAEFWFEWNIKCNFGSNPAIMKNYKIKKGDHFCSVSIFDRITSIGWNLKKYTVRFILHGECWWAPSRNADDNDLNKLTGVAFGFGVHSNSVRLTWVPDFTTAGKIKIYAYTYNEKTTGPKFTFVYITTVDTGDICDSSIEVQGDKYAITVNGVTIQMDNKHKDPGIYNKLYPYFGGNNTAPQDMIIGIDYL